MVIFPNISLIWSAPNKFCRDSFLNLRTWTFTPWSLELIELCNWKNRIRDSFGVQLKNHGLSGAPRKLIQTLTKHLKKSWIIRCPSNIDSHENQAVGKTGTSMIETLHDTSAMKTSNLTNTWLINQISKLINWDTTFFGQSTSTANSSWSLG